MSRSSSGLRRRSPSRMGVTGWQSSSLHPALLFALIRFVWICQDIFLLCCIAAIAVRIACEIAPLCSVRAS
jgi:hypothetical protein